MNDLAKLVQTLEDLKRHRETHKLYYYSPYPYQKAFHHAQDRDSLKAPFSETDPEKLAVQRALMAANQVGKTHCAGIEVTYHATGLYPDWWKGHKFSKPVNIVVSGKRNETVRDVCQNELLGDPFEESQRGTGTIPVELIGKTTRKAGVPNALTAVMVKHVSGGWSKIRFMAYEQGPEAFMGIRFDVGWLDEEPPLEVWTQFIRGTFSREHYTLFLTFTPEEGVTQVVDHFTNKLEPGQALIRATWADAEHMTPQRQEEYLKQLPPHERDMRSKGIPLMGSGLVFPVKEDAISCDPIPIPDHWPRIAGIDFGTDHPFACVWVAWDRDSDTVYIYDVFKKSRALMAEQVSTVLKRGNWIPIAWPHDGLQEDTKSGKSLHTLYRDEGLRNLLRNHFSNPPGPGQKEGQGGQGVETGLMEMLQRMETGRFKVFSHLSDWFEEFRQYHRKDGKVVKLKDDIISATRYAVMSLRFAKTNIIRTPTQTYEGVTNW